MTKYEVLSLSLGVFMAALAVLGAVLSLVMAGLAVWRIQVAVKTIQADHERRKKQATIDLMLQVRPLWQASRRRLDKLFGSGALSDAAVDAIRTNRDARDVVSRLLGTLEHMSVGINTGVFDKELLYRTSATFLTTIFHRLHPHIKEMQKELPTAYVEFSAMAMEFDKRRSPQPTNAGRIEHS